MAENYKKNQSGNNNRPGASIPSKPQEPPASKPSGIETGSTPASIGKVIETNNSNILILSDMLKATESIPLSDLGMAMTHLRLAGTRLEQYKKSLAAKHESSTFVDRAL